MHQTNRPPMGLNRIARYMRGREDNICVIIGTVTDDVRLLDMPKLRIACLRITENARARVTAAGGEIMTLDQLALIRPTGKDTVLLRGRKNARTGMSTTCRGRGFTCDAATLHVLARVRRSAHRLLTSPSRFFFLFPNQQIPSATHYYGAPGVPNSSTRPRVRSKNRKQEKARGRRKSRGFKV